MISTSDFIHIPYTPDLTEGGIAYACRSLACSYDRMGASPVDRMRRIVGGVAVELAFRRYLTEQGIPFDVLGATPFTHPDRYDVSLGGHRCDLKSFLITRRAQITQLTNDPSLALQAPALVPLDQFAAGGHKPDDLYLFAFMLGVNASAREDLDRAASAGQPAWLIHPLPDEWKRPAEWGPLEDLVLKSECESSISFELGGQDPERNFVTTTVELPPRKRLLVEQGFNSLAYVHAEAQPEARIGLHSSASGEAYIVTTHAWGNIWVYGMDIILIGWLAYEDFRRKAKVLNAGLRTFQYDRTRVKNLLVPMGELNPLAPLLERVRDWEKVRHTS